MLVVVILLLAAAGLLVSSYFTALAYRWVAPDAAWVPAVCRLGEGTCTLVVHTPRARVFGVPNSLLGQLYYLALLVLAAAGLLATAPVWQGLVAVSAGTVLLAAYLSYSLLFVLRVPCRLCFVSHGINLTIFLALLVLPA